MRNQAKNEVVQFYKIKEHFPKLHINHDETESSNFTDREIGILNLMADGQTANEIAKNLYLSPHTIKTHQRNMLRKSGCVNGAHLVAFCLRRKIIR